MTEKPKMQIIYRLVAFRIEYNREKAGMTQEKLAKAIGLDRTTVVNIERGRQRILLHTIKDIAVALNIKPVELLKGVWE